MLSKLTEINWHAVRLYRLAHRLHLAGRDGPARVVAAFNRVLTGVEIGVGAEIGAGLVIRHGNGIVIDPQARVGIGCVLYQQVTLGVRGPGSPGVPVLGDGVVVFAGAKVLGPIAIGDGAKIGANAVVLDDVPAGAVAVGVPARIRYES